MPRPQAETIDGPSHDSFLDIVANIVGILIILVMVTGVRAKHVPIDTVEDESVQAAAAALQDDAAAESSLRNDIVKTGELIGQIGRETLDRHAGRLRLAEAVGELEREIASAQEKLNAEERADFQLRQRLAESQSELDRLRLEQQVVETADDEPIVVESLPTPLSKTVDGDEIHFQLKGGRIAFIPLERLLGRFKRDAQQHAGKLLNLNEVTETVGPEGGFRLRYTLEREGASMEGHLMSGRGAYAKLSLWTLIPVSSQLGEPVDEALLPGSHFGAVVAQHDPEKTTITIWTYQDSFPEYRRLKKYLHTAGFPTAARPLPQNMPIGGAPDGTKSAAQ